jgi:hypothetical protein
MGIRKSYGKNKKSNRPTEAATVEREGILRQASKARGRSRPPGFLAAHPDSVTRRAQD